MKISEMLTEFRPSIHETELNFLIPRIRELNPLIIIEIGAFRGGSTSIWHHILDGKGLLISIDPNPNRKFYERFGDEPDNFMFIKGRSQDKEVLIQLGEALGDEEADFIFVDGDHSIMLQDWENYWPFLRDGGGMGFHDFKVSGKKTHRALKVGGWRRDYCFSPAFLDISEAKPKSERWGCAFAWFEEGDETIYGESLPEWLK